MVGRPVNPKRQATLLILCLGIVLCVGCARSGIAHQSEAKAETPAADQTIPFHDNSDHGLDESAHPAVPPDNKLGSGTPFPAKSRRRSLPAGTLITVRLENALSISSARPGDTFTSSLDGTINIDGETLIDRGARVSGTIESAQPSVDRPGLSPDPGYVRLTLKSITVGGKALALQTASLFAKGAVQSSPLSNTSSHGRNSDSLSPDLWVPKDRRLTFRLTAPVALADSNSIAQRY